MTPKTPNQNLRILAFWGALTRGLSGKKKEKDGRPAEKERPSQKRSGRPAEKERPLWKPGGRPAEKERPP
jgi:hypothetical protein